MRTEDFLRLVGEEYRGRIPAACPFPSGVERDWEWLESGLWEVVKKEGVTDIFLRNVQKTLDALRRDRLRYEDLVELFQGLDVREVGRTSWDPRGPVGRFLLALHDSYVLRLNRRVPSVRDGLRKERTCRRCGLCCIGPAEGPISTSPADHSRWKAMARDDLLYFTGFGSGWAPRARSLEFPCCPFLRFSAEEKNGHCLVHPVKPLVCQEFVCG